MKRTKTPTFLLELPLAVTGGQAKHLPAHFEAARCLYNALLDEALARLHRMWADPAQAGRRVPYQRHRSRNGRRRSPNSGKPTVSPSMPCMTSLSVPTARGSPPTLTLSWPKRW
jgi:hypothetical protein